MKPGEIRRYKQSSFPLLSAFVVSGQTGRSQTSSFPRLPGNGGQAETRRLPQITNKVPLVALSQEDRNTNVYQSKNSAKYVSDARRERAPDRNHAYRGKRSRGIVDSDLHHKTGPVGGQNSKPLARQKSRRKHEYKCESSSQKTLDENERSSLEYILTNSSKNHVLKRHHKTGSVGGQNSKPLARQKSRRKNEHKCESSASETLDENERSSLKDMLENSSKNPVLKRRHKSHVRESAFSVNTVGKVDHRRRIKSCDRSPTKSTKSLLEVKDEFRRQDQQINMTDTEIAPKKRQRNTSSGQASKAKRDAAPIASKPSTEKRWKCIMVRHSKKSTPMWVGNVPADSWEEECRNANNLAKHGKVNKKEHISETNIAKKRGIVKSEAQKETEKVTSKSVPSSKAVHSRNQGVDKGLTNTYMKGEESVKGNERHHIRISRKSTGLKQNEENKGKQRANQLNGINQKLTDASSKYTGISDGNVKRSKAVESIEIKNSKLPRNINLKSKRGASKAGFINCSHSQSVMHNVDSYNQKKGKRGSAIMETVVTHHSSKSLKGKNADTIQQRNCKKKCMHGGQVKQDRNKMDAAQEDMYHKKAKETVFKGKNACTNKSYLTNSNKSRKGRVLATSSEETKPLGIVESRHSNRNTIRAARSGSSNSSSSTTKRRVGTKSNQMNNTVYHTTSMVSTLHSPVSPGSKIPVLDRHSSTPNSKRSFASKRTTSSVSNTHTQRSVNKPEIENTKRQVLRKSTGSERKCSTKSSPTKQLVRATPGTGRPKNKTATTVSRTSAISVTPLSERPASTKASAVMSARSVAIKSVNSQEGRSSRKSNTLSSTSTSTLVSGINSDKHCRHTPQEQMLARSSSYRRYLSVKSSKHVSRIPVLSKSASYISRITTKSASKSTVSKPTTPVWRRTSSIKSVAPASGRSSIVKHEPTRPASWKHDYPSPDRPVSRTGSSASAKRISAIPVLKRSARANSFSSKRTVMSSASRSSRGSSISSTMSAGNVSTKSDASSIRSCISQASEKSVVDSMYDDDFEYESNASCLSVPSSAEKI